MSAKIVPDNSPVPRRSKTGLDQAVPTFNAEVFEEFTRLLGPAKSRDWLKAFRAGLEEEFSAPSGTGRHEGSRAKVHNFCAHAGLVGFEVLHGACLEFLETRPEQEEVEVAYQRVRVQAELAYPEIDRQRALLG